jgi:hypothetical protein
MSQETSKTGGAIVYHLQCTTYSVPLAVYHLQCTTYLQRDEDSIIDELTTAPRLT